MQPPLNDSADLSGQTAIVTGASSGLGWRFAGVLAARGAAVAVCGRRAERLDALVAEIRADGGTAEAFPVDVAATATLPDLVMRVEGRLGLVSILVNNAGIVDDCYATKMPVALVDRLLDVNVKAPFVLSSAVARRLIEARRPGRIVNISSIIAFSVSNPGTALYAVTKGALVRMTEALAVEWAPYGINVNAIAPGAFESEMMENLVSRVGPFPVDGFPRKRVGKAGDLDSTLIFLASPASEFVTGTVIRADDGQSPR